MGRLAHLDGGVPLVSAGVPVRGVVRPSWEVFLRSGHHDSSVFGLFQFGALLRGAFVAPSHLEASRVSQRQSPTLLKRTVFLPNGVALTFCPIFQSFFFSLIL